MTDVETTRVAARHWASVWKTAWEARDTDAIVAHYHPEALFSTEPFRVPFRGSSGVRSYVGRAFDEERDPRVWVGEPVVDGDHAAIEWWASLEENGREITLAGASMLCFDPDGLVVEQRDAWNRAEGLRSPPEGWGA